MRTLILSDLHSNIEAFHAVLSRVKRKKFDRIAMLGDVVGYGANPNQVVDELRGLKGDKVFVRGNHDKVCSGIDNGEFFNHVALTAAKWTYEKLSPSNRRFLKDLPKGPVPVDEKMMLCHGTPIDEDAYIFSDYDAYMVFRNIEGDRIFFGHSHIPSLFTLEESGIRVEAIKGDEAKIQLDPKKRYLINPGSIGQPRDRNYKPSFMVYDDEKQQICFERVAYDVEKAQQKIRKAGLPALLADRLATGT